MTAASSRFRSRLLVGNLSVLTRDGGTHIDVTKKEEHIEGKELPLASGCPAFSCTAEDDWSYILFRCPEMIVVGVDRSQQFCCPVVRGG